MSGTAIAIIGIVIFAIIVVFWQYLYPIVIAAAVALLIWLIIKIVQSKNACCMICGNQIRFMDVIDNSKVRPWLKNQKFYKNTKPKAKPYCCDSCCSQLAKLEEEHKLYGTYECQRHHSRDRFSAPYIFKLHDAIKNNTFHVNIDSKLFAEYINDLYSPLKNLEDSINEHNRAIDIAIKTIKDDIVTRKEQLKVQYPNLVFAKDEKYNHVSATVDNKSLVLIENNNPKIPTDYEKEKGLDFIEDELLPAMLKMDNKQMFAMTIIPLNDIVSFQLVGQVDRVTTTSGGGGGGGAPNLGGALLGGLLFGAAGAIIGAQTGIYIDPIKSSTTEYDTRKTLLNIKNEQGVAETRELPFYYAEIFTKVIPDKEFSFLQAEKTSIAAPKEEKTQDVNSIEALKKYKELLDMGVITQEEFDAKKKQLLEL